MSGHSKWHSIKHKKGAADAKRGKIFTKHAKLIAIAAKNGGDPEMNPALRTAIANAKADNVPNSNIDKAIKKGSGADKDAANFTEALYEGMGPLGTAFMIESITDNTNRTVSNLKALFSKNGGNLGSSGSAAWMFERKGQIICHQSKMSDDELELIVLESGAEDMKIENEIWVYTADDQLMEVKDNLEKSGLEILRAELVYVPNNPVKIDSLEDAGKVINFLDLIEDDDDVSKVHSNFEISEPVLDQLN